MDVLPEDFQETIYNAVVKYNVSSLPASECALVAQTVSTTLASLFEGVQRELAASWIELILNNISAAESRLFGGPNSYSFSNPAFDLATERAMAPTRDGRSVHLELGVSVAWPNEMVERFINTQKIGDLIRTDMNMKCPIDVACSVTALPFADESIDRISSNSLFEHVAYPHEIIREAFRVLRPGGVIFTNAPFHFVQHGFPRDYLRYTGQFFEDVLSDAGFEQIAVDTRKTSGVYNTTHQLLKAALPNKEVPHVGDTAVRAHIVSSMLLASLRGMDATFHAHGASHWCATHAIAVKPGPFQSRPDPIDRTLPVHKRYGGLICPASGLPLREKDGKLISLDNRHEYEIQNGVPNLFVLHGFGSSFMNKASAAEQLRTYRAGWLGRLFS